MKRIHNVMLVLTGIVLQRCYAEELNLNFQQHDYEFYFERLELVRYNKQLVRDVSMLTYKYNRSLAVANFSFIPIVQFGNDLESVTQAYKFMSNEYRHFPLRFAANCCKSLKANVAGIRDSFAKCGNIISCPIRKGVKYFICKWYPDQSKLPPRIPNGEYKIEIQLLYFSQEVLVQNMYVTVSRPIV